MIGVCRVRSRCRIRSATSKPSMPGIWTSIRISANSSLEQPAQRLDAGAGPDEVLAQVAQRRLEDEEVAGRVVDHENVDLWLGLHGRVSRSGDGVLSRLTAGGRARHAGAIGAVRPAPAWRCSRMPRHPGTSGDRPSWPWLSAR